MNPLAFLRKGTGIAVNSKVWAFKRKLIVWKTCIHHHELDDFPIVKIFSDKIVDDVNKYDF